jgi:hypothetical protein
MSHYGAQGGDTGAMVSPQLGRIDSDHVVGVHVNSLVTFPSGQPDELKDLSDADQKRLELMGRWQNEWSGNAILQSNRPQTLAHALTADSPVGQLAWIVKKFKDWTDPGAELPEDAVNLDRLLTDVTLYWAHRDSRIFRQHLLRGRQDWGQTSEPSGVPTGVAVFPMDARSDRSRSANTTSCTGASLTAAVTSPPWRHPTSSSTTSVRLPAPPLSTTARLNSAKVTRPKSVSGEVLGRRARTTDAPASLHPFHLRHSSRWSGWPWPINTGSPGLPEVAQMSVEPTVTSLG